MRAQLVILAFNVKLVGNIKIWLASVWQTIVVSSTEYDEMNGLCSQLLKMFWAFINL